MAIRDKSIRLKLFIPIFFGSIVLIAILLAVSRYYFIRAHRYDTETLIYCHR